MGQREYTVMIRYRQKAINTGVDPFFLRNMVTARAVAVPAGVVTFFHVTAGVADLPVGAELTAPAVLDIVHDLVLPGMQSVFGSELIAVCPEDITDGRT